MVSASSSPSTPLADMKPAVVLMRKNSQPNMSFSGGSAASSSISLEMPSDTSRPARSLRQRQSLSTLSLHHNDTLTSANAPAFNIDDSSVLSAPLWENAQPLLALVLVFFAAFMIIQVFQSMTDAVGLPEAGTLLYSAMQVDVPCHRHGVLHGASKNDTGFDRWEVCFDVKSLSEGKPCLVHSWSLTRLNGWPDAAVQVKQHEAWTFERRLAEGLQCRLVLFDPSAESLFDKQGNLAVPWKDINGLEWVADRPQGQVALLPLGPMLHQQHMGTGEGVDNGGVPRRIAKQTAPPLWKRALSHFKEPSSGATQGTVSPWNRSQDIEAATELLGYSEDSRLSVLKIDVGRYGWRVVRHLLNSRFLQRVDQLLLNVCLVPDDANTPHARASTSLSDRSTMTHSHRTTVVKHWADTLARVRGSGFRLWKHRPLDTEGWESFGGVHSRSARCHHLAFVSEEALHLSAVKL